MKRISKQERRILVRKAGNIIVALIPLWDGATADEVAHLWEAVTDFTVTLRAALAQAEEV